MLNISEEFINSTAPNESAVKNGWGLVKKKSFVKLCKSDDDTLIFGECLGSGSSNYICSVDFIKEEGPVFRCTCPSRQIPCKHTLGLMYSYINGNKFQIEEIPQDIIEKREKAEKREEKKKEAPSEPKKVNKTALAKKLKIQLEGLELLEKLIKDVMRRGFAAVDGKTLDTLVEQGKTLNSSYLPGAQEYLMELVLVFRNAQRNSSASEVRIDMDKAFGEALNIAAGIYSLCKKGREHLNKRLQDAEMALDKDTAIDELLGHAWQTTELEAAGLVENESELIQLFFNVYTNEAKKEFVDLGYWIDLKKGTIYKTCNYRPFRAANHIKEEDSLFSVLKANKMYIYPGDINRRVRFDGVSLREQGKEDLISILNFGCKSWAEAIKVVKNSIKNPLSDKNPVMFLKYNIIGSVQDDYVIEDAQGMKLKLRNSSMNNEIPTAFMLQFLSREALRDSAVLVRFHQSLETGELTAQPLTIITENEIIRLAY